MMSTRSSLLFSFLDRYASLAVSILSSMVIARLLTPTEVGVFSVVMVLLVFVSTVRDMGAGQYLVQEKNLTSDCIRAVWAIQLGIGLLLSFLVLLASYPVSWFYAEPRMFPIMLVVALNYAINPFGSLTYAWLMREMRFENVAIMRFVSACSGATLSVWLAWRGIGPISLAYGSLTSTVVNAVIALWYRPKDFPWVPGTREVRRVLSFGSKLTASSVVTVVASSAPELLLGKLQSLTAAGLFSRANGLVQMFHRLFVDAVGVVCLPWFAKLLREQGNIAAPFLKATAYVTALGWSFCLFVVLFAHPLIRLLYGSQWDGAVNLARLLAVSTAIGVPSALCQVALLSSGAVSDIARVTVASAIASSLLVFFGATLGLTEVGVAIVLATAISSFLWLMVTSRRLVVAQLHLWATLARSAVVALFSVIGPICLVLLYGLRVEREFLVLAMGLITAGAGLLVGVFVAKHPLRGELVRFRI